MGDKILKETKLIYIYLAIALQQSLPPGLMYPIGSKMEESRN